MNNVESAVTRVCAALASCQFNLSDEKRLQTQIASRLDSAGVDYRREVTLDSQGTIDFVSARFGIEVKIKGRKKSVYYQCERYLEHEEIDGLLLVTNLAIGMPETLCGKPIYLLDLGRAHL